MADILLVTFTARYSHSAFGLRYLQANLKELSGRAVIVEFDIRKQPVVSAEELLRLKPRIVCFSVHIWNIEQIRATAKLLKQIEPSLKIVIGGPEVSYELGKEPLVEVADTIVCGEGDLIIAELCEKLLQGDITEKIVQAEPPDLNEVALPYDYYSDEDIAHRVTYVETSRGCPFRCAYCMSALDRKVRTFPLSNLLPEFKKLMTRGARHFKFVDRSFNALPEHAISVLSFFKDNYVDGLVLHLELVPNKMSSQLQELLIAFPPGALHIEVGVQTFDEAVGKLVGRSFDSSEVAKTLKFLCKETKADVHADLIVGLPGETEASFGRGFDELLHYAPAEVQVGILKRLRGAPLVKKAKEWGLVFSETSPYEVLATKELSFFDIQRMKRFGRYVELLHNRGKLVATVAKLLEKGSPFEIFSLINEYFYKRFSRAHDISLENLAKALRDFMIEVQGKNEAEILRLLRADFQRLGRRRLPHWLNERRTEDGQKSN